MPGEKLTSNKPFLTVSDGRLTQRVDETHPEARMVTRTKKNGEKQTVYELYFKSWEGTVKEFRIKEHDANGRKWQTCDIVFPDAILSLNTNQSFFSDFAKRIKGVDINQPITVSPYSMNVDGKDKRGIVVYQNGQKFKSAYWDGEKTLHGMPTPQKPSAQMNKADWVYYFAQEEEFLIGEVLKLNEQINRDAVQEEPSDDYENDMAEVETERINWQDKDDNQLNF